MAAAAAAIVNVVCALLSEDWRSKLGEGGDSRIEDEGGEEEKETRRRCFLH